MRNLISNKTNIPLTKNEAVKVIASAAVLSVLGFAIAFVPLRDSVRDLLLSTDI